MRVLLINPKASQLNKRRKATSVPLGLMAIASYIELKGHTVKIVDLTLKSDNIKKHLKSFNPDVVALTVHSTLSTKSAIKISKTAKKYNKPVVWGGYIASLLTELCFKESCVDFIVIGEGEVTFSELLDSMENGSSYNNIDGLAYADKDGVHKNKDREFADLADFPPIDWSLVNAAKYGQNFFQCKKMIYVYLSKGCPAKCSFCYNPQYYKSTQRRRPPEYVVDEIEYVIENHGVDGIYFSDEFWYPGKEDMQTLFRLIKERELKFLWACQTRVGVFNKEELQQMYDAGCRWILFGVESGCEARIKEIKKGIDLRSIKETFDNCREVGITTQSTFIIGYPGETEEELKETVDFAFSLKADFCPFNILYFQPGSEFFDTAVSSGRYNPPESLKEWGKSQTDEYYGPNFSNVPRKELLVIHFYTQWLAFSQKKSNGSNPYLLAKNTLLELLDNMFKFGFSSFFIGTLVSAKQFLTVVWYAKAYPKVLKKYGFNKKHKR